MSLLTVILIVGGSLLLYYCGMIAYDLYVDKMSTINSEEEKEETIDISGQVEEFRSIPVSNPEEEQSFFERIDNFLRFGVPAAKMKTLINNATSDTDKQLQGILISIQNYQTEE